MVSFLFDTGTDFHASNRSRMLQNFHGHQRAGISLQNGFQNLTNHLQFLSCSYVFIYFWHFSFSNEKWFRTLLILLRWCWYYYILKLRQIPHWQRHCTNFLRYLCWFKIKSFILLCKVLDLHAVVCAASTMYVHIVIANIKVNTP